MKAQIEKLNHLIQPAFLPFFRIQPILQINAFRKTFLRIISWTVLIAFTTTQTVWGQELAPVSEPNGLYQLSKTLDEMTDKEVSAAYEDVRKTADSLNFLDDQNPLSTVSDTEIASPEARNDTRIESPPQSGVQGNTVIASSGAGIAPEPHAAFNENAVIASTAADAAAPQSGVQGNTVIARNGVTKQSPEQQNTQDDVRSTLDASQYDYDRYEFEDAIEQLRPEYASAVIVRSLTRENLQTLAQLDFEVGIAVINNEIVLFSSGDQYEIKMLPPAKDLLAHADLIAHTHVSAETQDGPSLFDLQTAVEDPKVEYMISSKGVYAYNHSGGLYGGKPVGFEVFVSEVQLSLDKNSAQNQTIVRSYLNEFIASMDSFNEHLPEDGVVLRSSDITIEAETMNGQGAFWNGGSYVSLWGDGKISKDYTLSQSGTYEIEVWAIGMEDNGTLPQMNLVVDGASAATAVGVTNNNWAFKPYVFSNVSLEAGVHEFYTDLISGTGSLGLSIDKIVIRRTGDLAPHWVPPVKIEAETMNGQGAFWNGGSYVSLWGDGKISKDYTLSQSGVYEIEVWAVGMEDNGTLPQMNVVVDGASAVAAVSVTNNNWKFKPYVFSDISLEAGTHEFYTDLISGTGSLGLSIDKIIIRWTGDLDPNWVPPVKIEAETMNGQGAFWNGGSYVSLWGDGQISKDYTLSQSGTYEIEVWAVGMEDNGTRPQMIIGVDGISTGTITEVTNNNWKFKPYVFSNISLEAGTHEFYTDLINGGGSLGLSIDKMIIRRTGDLNPNWVPPVEVQAEEMDGQGAFWNGGSYVSLWGDGQISKDYTLSQSGVYQIEVWAIGMEDNGTRPQMSVGVDGALAASAVNVTNNNWNFKPYIFSNISLEAGTHEFYTDLINGGGSLGLSIDKMIIRRTGDLPRPDVEFISPTETVAGDYVLEYRSNGILHQENWHLAPGLNRLVIEAKSEGVPYFFTYEVNYDSPTLPLLPGLLSQTDLVYIKLDLTEMTTDSGQKISDLVGFSTAKLISPVYDSDSKLTDGIIELEDGHAIQLIEGKIRQLLDPAGTLQYFSENGELEFTINPDGSRTNFAIRMDNFSLRTLSASTASSPSNLGFYDLDGRLRYAANNDEETVYDSGILNRIQMANGVIRNYQIIAVTDGFESRLIGTPVDVNNQPVLLHYDANRNLSYAENSDGANFEFQDGVVAKTVTAAGVQTQYTYENSGLGDFLGFQVDRAGVQRTYDEEGKLAQIVTSEGMTAQIENESIAKVDLGAGQYATDLQFDSDGNVTEMRVHNTDGTIAHYIDDLLVDMELPDHSVIVMEDGKARFLKTADGRTYRYVYVLDGSGNETAQALRAELIAYSSPADNTLNLESGNLTEFVLESENPLDSFTGGSPAAGTSTFIPILSTPANIIRNLELDTDGNMINAEILNHTGDQYFIVDGKLERIITINGKVLNFKNEDDQQPEPDPVPLTAEEAAYRDELIEQTLQYFKSGQGVDSVTGLPFDAITEDGSPFRITQPTAIGFYLQILGSIMDGSYVSDLMTKAEALLAAQKAIASLQQMQADAGWNGLLPFVNLGTTFTRYGNGIGLGDNANLAQSLASLIGSIENAKVSSGLNQSGLNSVISSADAVLNAMSQGFTSFYDSSAGLFRSSYNVSTGVFSGFNDRLMNEFRTGIAFVIIRYNLPQGAWDNLVAVTRTYQDRQFNDILNAVPFDGGAFQMFWPLFRATQELTPEMKAAAWNFLYSMADYAEKNGLAGFPSASFDPISQDYEGKIGVPELAETRDALNDRTVSVYALASAYALAPQFVLSWLKEIQTKYPSIIGPYGFYDSLAMPAPDTIGAPVVGERVYAIDQGSFLLGLINSGGEAFNKYLDMRGYRNSFDDLYNRLKLNITPVEENLLSSPFGTDKLLSVQPPHAPPSGFHLTDITNSQSGKVSFDYLLSPLGAVSDVDTHYTVDGISRTSDLLTYFEQTQNRDEISYLLDDQPVNLFNENVEQGAVFTPGEGSSVESRIQDSEKGFVKAFDYTIVSGGDPVGYYAKFNDLDLSDVDFLTFSVRREAGSTVPESLEIKLEGLGETFIVDSIPTNWTRVVLPLKKPNTDLSRVAILIHDQVTEEQSGRVYLGDISLFSLKDYTLTSWESEAGLTKTEIEILARDYLTNGTLPPDVQEYTTLTNLDLDENGDIRSAQVNAKNGAVLYIQGGGVTKVVTPDGKTILYSGGKADSVTSSTGDTAKFNYTRDFKGDVQQIILAEAGIKRVYDTTGRLERLIFSGLSGGLDQGILTSLRTRFESITDLVGDEFGHIKDAKISLADGRVLIIGDYKLVKTIFLSGTEVTYDADGYVTSTKSKEGLTDYIYTKDVSGKITRVDVSYVKDGATMVKNLVPFLQEDNRVEEAAILLETPLVNLSEIASNIGAFFTPGRGIVIETKATDPERNDILRVDYDIPSNPLAMGIYFRFPTIDLSQYEIMNVALKKDPWSPAPSVTIELKGAGNDRITLNNITTDWQDTNVPIDNLNSSIYEVTMLINPTQLNTSGTLYLDDISFFNLRQINAQSWQDQLSFGQSDLEIFSNEITQAPLVDPLLYDVPVPAFQELRDFQGLPTVLSFDENGKIQQFTRGDGTEITVDGNLPISAQLSNGQVISYQTDSADKRITSATVTNSETQATTTTQYSYDRTRSVTLEDGKNLEYHYEFDEQGNEITVVKDPDTGETKRFVNGQIQKSEDSGGLITTYTFDASGNLVGSDLSFQGKAELDLTNYERRGDKTFITDRSGITWIYDAGGVLIQHLTPDGLLYQHTTATDENGQLQRLIFLIQKTAEDGTHIYYENGEISKITFSNGMSFVNPQYDENHDLNGAKVLYEDGSEVDYQEQFAVKVTNLFGDVTTYALPEGKIFLESSNAGKVEFLRIERDGLTLRYNREGDLVNLITPDDVLYQYVYEEENGAKTGRMKIYRRELSKVAGLSLPFTILADADSYGNMHVLINDQLVDSVLNNVRVLAINPADGHVDAAGSFDMSLTGMGEQVLNFINAISDGEYVLMMYPQTSNGYSSDSASFMTALEAIGGDRTKPYIASKPWMVLGQKGLLSGQAFDSFQNYDFNGGTIRLNTEKRDVYYLDAGGQVISQSDYGFADTLLDTSRHGNYTGEMTEVFGTISKDEDLYAAAYFKNYNIKYPESGLYRLLGDFEDRNFIEQPVSYLDEQLGGLLELTQGFSEKAIYYDERYPVRGISVNNLRALKGYLVSKGFRVLNADQLKIWMEEKGPDSVVLMAQDIAPDTIIDISSTGIQLPREYVNSGGSVVWLYDIPFYEIGHANHTSGVWGSVGDNYGLRSVFGISLAYETTSGKPVGLYDMTPSMTLDPLVLSQPLKLDFDIRELDTWQSIKTTFENSIPSAETDIGSVFDENGVVLGVRKADGTQNVFEDGKLRSILDREGLHLIDYFYNTAGELIGVDYIQARQELAAQIHNAEIQVAKLKTDALMQVALNHSIGIQDIQNQVIAGRASLADSRAQIESQRYVRQCYQCGCSECCEEVENPGYQQALANVAQAEKQLEADAATALSDVDTEVANAYTQIDTDENTAAVSIRSKETEVTRSIIQNEITPVLMQFYRMLLGRDPSSAEMTHWLDEAVADPNNRVDTESLKTELSNSPERSARLSEITLIKADVRTFLDGYIDAAPEVRVSMAASLGLLTEDEIVTLDAAQVDQIMAFLDTQNLHFGYSAFLPLQTFLEQNNIDLTTREIASKAILIDVLTGSINPYSEGDLRISLFALERTAKVAGASPTGAKLTFEELRQIYADNPDVRLIVHIKGNHYVTLVNVTGDTVSYIESAMGGEQVPGVNAVGEIVEVSKEQFLELWINPVVNQNSDQAMGVALLPDQIQVQPERVLDSNIAKLIQGAFCGWDDFLIAVVITAVISGTVQAISAGGGNFVTNFLKGFAFGAITGAITFGIGAVLSSFASAVTSVAGQVVNGIKTFVQPIINGFKVIGSAVGHFISNVLPTSVSNFLGGAANWIGRGITAVKSFTSNVVKVATDGFKSLRNYVQTATGVKKFVVNSLLGLAVDYGTNKGLVALGVNPTIASLTSAFVTGGFLGALNAPSPSGSSGSISQSQPKIDGVVIGESIPVSGSVGAGKSITEAFVLGGTRNLVYQAVPLAALHFNLSGETANVLQVTSKALLGAGGNITNNVLKGLGKDLVGELIISGANAIGPRVGLENLSFKPSNSTKLEELIKGLTNANGGGGPGTLSQSVSEISSSARQLQNIDVSTTQSVEQQFEQKYDINGAMAEARSSAAKLIPDQGEIIGSSNYGQYVGQKGIAEALDDHSKYFFKQSSIEEMLGASPDNTVQGFINEQISNGGLTDVVDGAGRSLKRLTLTNDLIVEYDPTTLDIVNIREGNFGVSYQDIRYNPELNHPQLLQGDIVRLNPVNDVRIDTQITGGRITQVTFSDAQGNLGQILPLNDSPYITGNEKAFFEYKLQEFRPSAGYKVEGGFIKDVQYTITQDLDINGTNISVDILLEKINEGNPVLKAIAHNLEHLNLQTAQVDTVLRVIADHFENKLKSDGTIWVDQNGHLRLNGLSDVFDFDVDKVTKDEIINQLDIPADRMLTAQDDLFDYSRQLITDSQKRTESEQDVVGIRQLLQNDNIPAILETAHAEFTAITPSGDKQFETSVSSGVIFRGDGSFQIEDMTKSDQGEIFVDKEGTVYYSDTVLSSDGTYYATKTFQNADGTPVVEGIPPTVKESYQNGQVFEINTTKLVKLEDGSIIEQPEKIRIEVANVTGTSDMAVIVRKESGNFYTESVTKITPIDPGTNDEDFEQTVRGTNILEALVDAVVNFGQSILDIHSLLRNFII